MIRWVIVCVVASMLFACGYTEEQMRAAQSAHPASAPDSPGACAKDTDCKGDRVCNQGQCVAPN
jgi:hypothetical protein